MRANEIAVDARAGAAPSSRLLRAVAAALLLATAGEARAARLRTLVLVGAEDHRELAARIKGQAADLDAVVATAEGVLPTDLGGQLAVARAARDRADVVVWFAADGRDWVAYIARGERVLVRRIAVAPGTLSRSASIEAVALAVRTALTGFAAAGEPEGRDDDESAPRLRPWAEIGWAGLHDGTRALAQYGVALVGAARGRHHLAAMIGFQPSTAVDVRRASIEVERQQVGVSLGTELLLRPAGAAPRWSFGVELGLGAVRFRRVTTATGSGLVATPAAATWSPLATPAVRLARRVVSAGWIAFEAGADVVARPPQFVVQRSGGFDRLASMWAFQPRATLSLIMDWR